MAIMIPDYGADAGAALARLGQGLADIINPDAKFHEAVRDAMVTNIEFGQGLADLKFANNGVLPSIYGKRLPKDVVDAINGLQPSVSAIKAKAAKSGIASLTPEQQTVYAQSLATGEGLLGTARGLAVAPQVAGVAGQAPGTPPTSMAQAGAQEVVAGAPAGRQAADLITAQLTPAAQSWLSDLQRYDAANGTDYYKRVAAEHFSLLDDEHFREAIAARKQLAGERQGDRTDLIHEHEANFWINKSGGLGTPEMWKGLLYDPKVMKHLEEIRASGPKTADDRMLLRMQNYRETQGAAYDRALTLASTVSRDKAIEAIIGNPAKKRPPANNTERPGYLSTLNDELAREGVPVVAFWGKGLPNGQDISTEKLRFHLRSRDQVEVDADHMYSMLQRSDQSFTTGTAGGFDVPSITTPGRETTQPAAKPTVTLPLKPPAKVDKAVLWESLRKQYPQLPADSITAMVNAAQ